ncbi:MAG: DUF5666 domain-containing protein [Candidatus Moraniibacteriota bacterium]
MAGSLKPGHLSQRQVLSIASLVLGALLLVVVSFSIGFSAGLQKARFSYAWGENYERNFMGPAGGPMGPDKLLKRMDGKMLRSGHGAAGEIISLNGDTIAVTGLDGEEWSFSLSANTKIKKGGESVGVSRLEVGDRIIVLGRPNAEGALIADFIRAIGKDDVKQIDDVLEKAGLPLPTPTQD